MYKIVKKSKVRMKDLSVGDTFIFVGDRHMVVEELTNDVICYNYYTHSTIRYNKDEREIVSIECTDDKQTADINTLKVDSLSELKIGDIFTYMNGNWQVFLGKSKGEANFACYDLNVREIKSWYGNFGPYNKLVDDEVEFVFKED